MVPAAPVAPRKRSAGAAGFLSEEIMKTKLILLLLAAAAIAAPVARADGYFLTDATPGRFNSTTVNDKETPHVIVASGTVTATAAGAANVASSQVAASTTAGTLVIARPTRRSCLVRNLDTSISVYIGPATVTAGNGMLLKPGESVPITAVTLWQVIAASGTPTVAVLDEYD